MYKAITFGFLLVILTLAQQSFAAKFDGSATLLCASMEAIECGVSGDCYGGTAESVNIPHFLKIDFAEKTVKTLKEGEKKVRSPIRSLEQMDGKLVLQGIENSRGWSIVISEETGKMSATVAGDEIGFIVFGACTPL